MTAQLQDAKFLVLDEVRLDTYLQGVDAADPSLLARETGSTRRDRAKHRRHSGTRVIAAG